MLSAYQTTPVDKRREMWSRSDDAYKSINKSSCSPGAKYTLPDPWAKKNVHRSLQYVPPPSTTTLTSSAKKIKNRLKPGRKGRFRTGCMPAIGKTNFSSDSIQAMNGMTANEMKGYISMKTQLRQSCCHQPACDVGC